MDVTPVIPAGRQVIERYGEGRFKVTGQVWEGSILVRPTRTLSLAAKDFAGLDIDGLKPIFEADPEPLEILLIGCGPRMAMIPPTLRAAVKAMGPAIDAMDTGAASRTYNVLMSEGRRVAAALIAVT
ncbi:Mth938-like domain-containing protein [Lacibacterium aquatile]|uniref:Mth938-like domain-containing protein n=1 Tax=Lacibacterium aquatile TaxID=1168082 RepID=A0ABW5DNV2_9PROT